MKRDDLCHDIRECLKRLPAPFEAHYGVVPPPPPETGVLVAKVVEKHQAASVALTRMEILAGELADPYLISRILPRREAVSSSSIEGTNSTLDELLGLEESESEETSEAAVQVRDYAVTLESVIPRARSGGHTIFTTELVQELHRAVMAGDKGYKDEPGALRKGVVWIGGRDIAYSSYNPAPPEDVEACLEESMAYMRAEDMQAMQQSLITRMAVAHAHFEAVHPFRDGNGRVGRLLLPLMMAGEGNIPLYLSPYIEANKIAYYEALKGAQQRLAWHEMIGFLSDAVTGSVNELIVTRDALKKLANNWAKRRRFRKNSGAVRAIDMLPHYPVLTVGRLASLLGITFAAASQALAQLEEVNIVTERTGYARNRVFVASDALSIINRPFGEIPVMPEDG